MAAIIEPKALSTTFLDQPPSCLEFCPTVPDFFVIGTYLLTIDESVTSSAPDSVRSGSLQLFKLEPESFHISQIEKLDLDYAVLDLHFSPSDPSLLAVALSSSLISLYRIESFEGSNSNVSIRFINKITVHDDPARLSLSLSWLPPSPGQDRPSGDGFAVSFSDGQVSIFRRKLSSHWFKRDSLLETRLGGSPIEVWYVAFHKEGLGGSDQLALFSGDDLNQVRKFQLPEELDGDGDDELLLRSWQVGDRGKQHTAGVTAILPLCDNEGGPIILTGSYDQSVRVYHYRARGEILASKDLDGGVWRLKLIKAASRSDASSPQKNERGEEKSHIARSYLVLASCMHAGARIIRVTCSITSDPVNSSVWDIQVLAKFSEHTSMNYASDVWMGKSELGEFSQSSKSSSVICVTSSFYDKRVCVWEADV